MNEQRFVVSDILWQRLEPHLPGKVSDAGVTAKDNRMFLEAIFWRVRLEKSVGDALRVSSCPLPEATPPSAIRPQ